MKRTPSLRFMLSLLVATPLLAANPLTAASPAAAAEGSDPVSIVATTEVLGSVVSQLAGDVADVTILMRDGVDPHAWQPSARDSEAVFGADVVVANGLDLEEGLASVLEQAEADGVTVFHAADHVQLRASAGAEPSTAVETDHAEQAEPGEDADDSGEADHAHAAGDPHFWLDPLAMRDVVLALDPVLTETGVELQERTASLVSDLEALDAELTQMLAVVPAESRQLVTGHGAMGYFADRYGFEIVGTVVPGLSSSDEPSAQEIAQLIDDIRAAGTAALFTDVGTPASVARAVADETGARIVELQVAQLHDGGTYQDLLRDLAGQVADALGEPGSSE